MPISVKDSGVWRTATSVYARAGGAWRQAKNVWVKVAGVWQLAYYRFTGTQTYTAGQSGQWTVPAGTYTIEVTVIGGGGGASGSQENDGTPTYGSGGGG